MRMVWECFGALLVDPLVVEREGQDCAHKHLQSDWFGNRDLAPCGHPVVTSTYLSVRFLRRQPTRCNIIDF